MLITLALAVTTLSVSSGQPASGSTPTGFEDTLIDTLNQPMGLAWTPDGRLLIPRRTGKVEVYIDEVREETEALDLAGVLCKAVERGLQGVAVHPEFETNNWIYLFYTFDKHGGCDFSETTGPVNRISRFVLPPSSIIDPQSEVVLLESTPLNTAAHNSGNLEFGPDGYLYATMGDGRDSDSAQETGNLWGNLLRLTDTGDIPAGNAFSGAGTARCHLLGEVPVGSPPGTQCQEIYAYGFRNPFRFAVDPNVASTRLFVNDVGATDWEEINEITSAGGNFGWADREGPCSASDNTSCDPTPGYVDPVHWYPHSTVGGAITGGAFVPDGLWPVEYDGTYLFGDYVDGKIYLLSSGGPDCRTCDPPTSAYMQTEFLDAPAVVEMAFGPYAGSQALYYATWDDEIRRVVYVGAVNRQPTADIVAAPLSGLAPLVVSFDGRGSSDPDNDPLTYAWDFDDPTSGFPTSSDSAPTHQFDEPGVYAVELVVDDGQGGTASSTVQVSVDNTPPIPVIDLPADGYEFTVGETLVLTGTATDLQDGPLPDSALTWEVRKHHNTHFHPYLTETAGNGIEIVAPAPEDFDAATNSYLEVILTATDLEGLTSAPVSRIVLPSATDVTIDTVPQGRDIVVDGTQIVGGDTILSWEGHELTVTAPRFQNDQSGNAFSFQSWSDGGAATHQITVPETATSLSATFFEGTTIRPFGTTAVEGDAGSHTVFASVFLEAPSPTPVTIDWATGDVPTNPSIAHPGEDFVAASGTVTFLPGEIMQTVPIEILGDTIDEPPLLYGEWGLIQFMNPSANALLDTSSFFGLGLFIIFDDD